MRIGLALALLAAATVGLQAAAIAGAASRKAHATRHRAPIYRGTQGASGGFCLNKPIYAGYNSVARSKTLKITIEPTFVTQGDLLLAAIASHGNVRPPSGWTFVDSTRQASSGVALDVFYKTGGRVSAANSFTSPTSQRMSGALLDLQGVSRKFGIPLSAGKVNPRSKSVTAPSVTPGLKHSLLVFVGATRARRRWTAPRGMTAESFDPVHRSRPVPLFIASQRWPSLAATGRRTARIGRSAPSVAELIALHYPAPVSCPKVKVVNHRYRANRKGVMSVRMACDWAARCRGWFLGGGVVSRVSGHAFYGPPLVALSRFSIPAGRTRTVRIALTRHGRRALKKNHRLPVGIELWAFRSNGQLIIPRGPNQTTGTIIGPGG